MNNQFVSFFERKKACACAHGGGAKAKGERESQAGSMPSMEPHTRSIP